MASALTTDQERALEEVRKRNLKRRTMRATLEADLRAELEARLEKAARDEATAVAEAVRLGVSKARVGREGLGTRDPYAVYRALEVAAS